MSSGKTTIGKSLAGKLRYSFMDMDSMIEYKAGMSISKIFTKQGEAAFRKMERQALEELVQKDNLVVSTGGGVPCEPGNMEYINEHGTSIYLQMDAEALHQRLKSRNIKRPLIRDLSEEELMDYIRETLSKREAYYNMAHFKVDGSRRDLNEIMDLLSA